MVHNATGWGLGRAQTQPHLTFLQLRILCGSAGGLLADLGLQPGAASTLLYIDWQLKIFHGCAVSIAWSRADRLQQCAGWWMLATDDRAMCKFPSAVCMQVHTMMDWAGGQEQDPGLWMLGTDDSGHWATKLWSGNAKSCAFGRKSSEPGARTLYGGVEPAGKLAALLGATARPSSWPHLDTRHCRCFALDQTADYVSERLSLSTEACTGAFQLPRLAGIQAAQCNTCTQRAQHVLHQPPGSAPTKSTGPLCHRTPD